MTMNHDTSNISWLQLYCTIESCKVKRRLSFDEQRQWSNPSFSHIEFRGGGESERTAAVQWEPAGRSNRAIPLGVTQRTTAASLFTSARSRWTDWTHENKVHHWRRCRTDISDTKQMFYKIVVELNSDLHLIFIQHSVHNFPNSICVKIQWICAHRI